MAQRIVMQIPAKVNLSLDITGKRPDGYHTLCSVFQTVGVFDRLTLTKTGADTPLSLSCDTEGVPCDARNLVWKAAVCLLGENPCGVAMHLEKGIPAQAGMGGGSADCAAALLGIRALLGLAVSDEALHGYAARLGADVPFFLQGGTVLCEGIGELLTPLPDIPECTLLLAKGSEGVSTPEGYRALDRLASPPADDTDNLLRALETRDPASIFAACGNHFDAVTNLPEIEQIRSIMRAHGIRPVLSGSGAAVFGGCTDPKQAQDCAETLRQAGLPFVRIAKTVPFGARIETESEK